MSQAESAVRQPSPSGRNHAELLLGKINQGSPETTLAAKSKRLLQQHSDHEALLPESQQISSPKVPDVTMIRASSKTQMFQSHLHCSNAHLNTTTLTPAIRNSTNSARPLLPAAEDAEGVVLGKGSPNEEVVQMLKHLEYSQNAQAANAKRARQKSVEHIITTPRRFSSKLMKMRNKFFQARAEQLQKKYQNLNIESVLQAEIGSPPLSETQDQPRSKKKRKQPSSPSFWTCTRAGSAVPGALPDSKKRSRGVQLSPGVGGQDALREGGRLELGRTGEPSEMHNLDTKRIMNGSPRKSQLQAELNNLHQFLDQKQIIIIDQKL